MLFCISLIVDKDQKPSRPSRNTLRLGYTWVLLVLVFSRDLLTLRIIQNTDLNFKSIQKTSHKEGCDVSPVQS